MARPLHTTSTSAHTADTDPVLLRQNEGFRLIFRPMLLDNPKDTAASVRGEFVFQRKGATQSWEDHKVLSAD
jgi:hypothetical protein